jgi:hypothetical protein
MQIIILLLNVKVAAFTIYSLTVVRIYTPSPENVIISYLVYCLFQVDFSALQIENSIEQARRQEQERRQNLINQEKLKKVTAEINGLCCFFNITR